eukprot:5906608-Prymnesium_polylepis.1
MAPPHHHKHHAQHHLGGHHGHHAGGNYSLTEYRLQLQAEDALPAAASSSLKPLAGLSFSRVAELALLCGAALSCAVLWCAARRKRPHAAPAEESGEQPPPSPTPREERTYRQLRNSYLSVYALA